MSIKSTELQAWVVLAVAAAMGLAGCNKSVTATKDTAFAESIAYNNEPVKIGDLTWTKNLNIETPDSWCYDNNPANCVKYGRLYTWDAAKKACQSMGGKWRLPTNEDWDNLMTAVGGVREVGYEHLAQGKEGPKAVDEFVYYDNAGIKLKSKSGWFFDNNYKDDYGFSGLPGGHRYPDGGFRSVGKHSDWWSATEGDSCNSYNYNVNWYYIHAFENYNDKAFGFSVRCVKD